MGERFFNVDTGLSALNAGKVDAMENDLMEAPEDGDIDDLNDETFGGGGEWDEDWEEQHEKLAEGVEGGPGFFQQDMLQNGHQADTKLTDRQEDLEHSLSQLVVDDEDDVIDPAIINTSKYQPIQGHRGKVNLDNLFGPSSPPGFLNTEHLVSPDKANIWGSPTTREEMAGMVAREGGGINNLLRMLQQQQQLKTRQNVSPQQDPSILMVGKPLPMVPGKVHSLEELEKNLLTEKPRPIMANDLERQIERGNMPPPHIVRPPPGILQQQSNKNMPLMTPPVVHGHDMMDGNHQNSFPHSRGIPIPGARPRMPHQGSGGLSGSSPSSHSQGLPSFLANTPVKQQRGPMHMGMSDPTHLVRPRSNGPFPPHLKQNLFNHEHASPGENSFNSDRQYNQHNGSYNRDKHMSFMSEMEHDHQGSPRQHGHYPNDRYFSHGPNPRDGPENRRYSYESRGDGRPRGRGWGHHQGHHHYQWQHHQRMFNSERGGGDMDEYARLMTQKEKDWIIKIQLLQLHTENPYLDDYYYTTWNMNRIAIEREKRKLEGQKSAGKDDKELQLVIPQLAKLESRSYKPVQFEGSLGRLTASSVHNPRQIIQVAINSSTDVEEPKQGRRFKRLLMYIEDHYNLLLDIDDIEKKALALPEEMRPTLYQQRKNLISELHSSFHCDEEDDLLERMMSIRKGVTLMARLMMLLDRTQSKSLMKAVLSNLHFFMKKDYQETYGRLFESMWRCITKGKFEDLVVWAEALDVCAQKFLPIAGMLQNQFTSSVLWSLLIRGEEVYAVTSPVDMEVDKQNIWSSFVQQIGDVLNGSTDVKLATPALFTAACLQHLERLLDKKTWLSIEDKLTVLTS